MRSTNSRGSWSRGVSASGFCAQESRLCSAQHQPGTRPFSNLHKKSTYTNSSEMWGTKLTMCTSPGVSHSFLSFLPSCTWSSPPLPSQRCSEASHFSSVSVPRCEHPKSPMVLGSYESCSLLERSWGYRLQIHFSVTSAFALLPSPWELFPC